MIIVKRLMDIVLSVIYSLQIPFLFEVPRLTAANELDSVCGLSSPLLLGYGDIGIPGCLSVCVCVFVHLKLWCFPVHHPSDCYGCFLVTIAALLAFALHMDKTLHPDAPFRAYYIITVIG